MLDTQDPEVRRLLNEDAEIRATQQHWGNPIPLGEDAPILTPGEIAGIHCREEIRERLSQLRKPLCPLDR